MKRLTLVLMSPLALIACCYEDHPPPSQPAVKIQTAFPEDRASIAALPEFQLLADGVRQADTVELFAAMPPPAGNGSAAYATEIAKSGEMHLHGWTFYEKPIPLEKADVETLRAACANADNFRTATAKACEGVYPEYMLRWKHGDHAVDTIFRLGCGQVGERSGKTVIDFDVRAATFAPVLTKYHPVRGPKG
jgi:hypothetical protein